MTMFYNGFNLMIDLIIGGLAYYVGYLFGRREMLYNFLTSAVDVMKEVESKSSEDDLTDEDIREIQAEWLYQSNLEQRWEREQAEQHTDSK